MIHLICMSVPWFYIGNLCCDYPARVLGVALYALRRLGCASKQGWCSIWQLFYGKRGGEEGYRWRSVVIPPAALADAWATWFNWYPASQPPVFIASTPIPAQREGGRYCRDTILPCVMSEREMAALYRLCWLVHGTFGVDYITMGMACTCRLAGRRALPRDVAPGDSPGRWAGAHHPVPGHLRVDDGSAGGGG